jgi:hypothetical protein
MLPSNASDWDTSSPSRKQGGPRWVGLVVMLGLLIVLAGVIYVAVTRLPTTLSRPPGAASSSSSTGANGPAGPAATAVVTPAPGVPADAATQAALQQVVQNLDDAQSQAIATQDPNVMAATATPDFYAEEVAANQELVDSGVTDIKMVKAEFSQATVDGTTATITVYETWTTSFKDGTTEQARDRNIYTLIQDNGTWKVQTDDHPDEPPAPGTPGANGS